MAEQDPKQPQAAQKAPEAEPYQFFNVMPKISNDGGVVSPMVAVTEATGANVAPQKNPDLSWVKAHGRYLIIGGVALIAAIIGYVAYAHFVLNANDNSQPVQVVVHHSTSTQVSNKNSGNSATTPAAWQTKYFGSSTCQDLTVCGDSADPDRDGLTNLQEYKLGTDPNHADSDNDGLADGDEINVFLTNPLTNHSGKNPKYSDSDNLKSGYNFSTDQKYTAGDLASLKQRMSQFGLHEPTLSTLGDALLSLYSFTGSATSTSTAGTVLNSTSTPQGATTSPSSVVSGLDQSAQAKQDRDAQRTNTIQTIATVLLKYQSVAKTFPATNNFTAMYADIKPYNIVATNPVDPINQDPFVYSYALNASGSDFTLSFYSETQNQLIKIHAADAQKYADQQAASGNDDQRKSDLESLQSALLLYSNANAAGNQNYVFPTQAKYKTAVVPQYISAVPVDPVSHKDYDYEVSSTFDTFTLKAVLQNPPTGSTGYMCNQLDCGYY